MNISRFLSSVTIALTALTSLHAATPRDNREVTITLLETTDVHGNLFPTDYIAGRPWPGSLARVATYVDSLRSSSGRESVILLDNGDLLQGQPTVYLYNFIDTVSPHAAARALSFLGYDALTLGNHDIETGHPVYDRFIAQSTAAVLGANIIDEATGRPYVKPYTIINRHGLKIAVLGMITPAIPTWLPRNLWQGLHFDDMAATAARWVPVIIEREHPDAIIGLFHSGGNAETLSQGFKENASLEVGQQVAGFDAIFMGHDHRVWDLTVQDPEGRDVVVVNPAANAVNLGRVDITFTLDPDGRVISKKVKGSVMPLTDTKPSESYMEAFAPETEAVATFVGREIGLATGPFRARDAYFGPSSFIDLIHRLQLEIGRADVSMAAPLSFDAVIDRGPVTMADMFSLYKYENLLYTMALTGREIKDYLEESYDIWTNQISSPEGHLIRFASDNPTPADSRLKYPSYNFDSAAGINYTVDVTKPKGEKITILSMADGTPFDPAKTYRVAINSYRGNGGGNLLTDGAGIPHDELPRRILQSTDKDLRFYLMEAIEEKGVIEPTVTPNWRFIPEEIARPAAVRDSLILFSRPSSIQK